MAKVPARQLTEMVTSPFPERLMEMIALTDFFQHLGGGFRTGDDPRHVARHDVDEKESKQSRAQERQRGPEKSEQKAAGHSLEQANDWLSKLGSSFTGWVEPFLQTLPQQVEGEDRQHNGGPRHHDQMRGDDEIGLAFIDHRTPGRRGRRNPDPQITE